jgi:hypothetical protein
MLAIVGPVAPALSDCVVGLGIAAVAGIGAVVVGCPMAIVVWTVSEVFVPVGTDSPPPQV